MLCLSGVRRSLFAGACLAAAAVCASSQVIPPSTAIPVVFTQSLQAGQAKPGDAVRAKTMEVVFLPNGRILPAGSTVIGHVVSSTRFLFDATPYAVQKPAVLSVHFDSIAMQGQPIPVALVVRAVAGPVASHEAEAPHDLDEIDWSGTRVLIGGERTSPLEKTVLSADGRIAGYSTRQGVFARLLAADDVNPDSDVHCAATATEQSVGIFSADACGAYGLNGVSLTGDGRHNHATFVLESTQRTVKLFAGSTALLQVMAD